MRLNIRGRYEGGGMIVTSARWWSRRGREDSRIAAAILEHEAPRRLARLQERYTNAALTGVDIIDARGNPVALGIPWPVDEAGYPLPSDDA